MTTKSEKLRREAKADAVCERIVDMYENLHLLVGMMEENKLDLMILALGIGSVELEGREE